ncbi:pyridoxamine 5'-phosphate oxidase family protein [Fulvimarina endophytica]|nr:pyridoxamine 5'-phosphate oxidase family protein [Fulvimarina endophytica]
MTTAGRPDWYDDLDGTLANALREMASAVDEREHGFRTFSLATLAEDGSPRSRVVVLREVEEGAWRLRFNSDLRSAKIGELEREGRVALLFHDKDLKLQLRLRGRATVHAIGDAGQGGAPVAARAFTDANSMSRVCYRVRPGPGTRLDEPGGYDHADVASTEDGDPDADPGAPNFAAITVDCEEIEVLYLAREGHRRSRFRRGPDAQVEGEWLTP